jgi:hypothetical protein
LQEDKMLAVLPKEHPLSTQTIVSLKDLMKEPFILLDEIGLSEPLTVFQQNKLEPNVQFRVYDDFAIMSMIEKKAISPSVARTISLAYKDKKVLLIASRYFIDFIIERYGNGIRT